MHSNRVRRRAVLAAALAGIAAATAVAGPASAAAEPTGSLSGVVRDTAGAVVPGASVAVYLDPSGDAVQELPADSRGRFSFTGLEAGAYKVRLGLGGWAEWAPGRIDNPDQARAYQVREGRNTVVNSTVTQAGYIAGRFLAPDGSPAAGAAVNITNVNDASQHAGVAAADGTYRIRVQPNQSFVVNFAVGPLGQYVPHTFDRSEATEFFVRAGRTVRVNDQAIALSGISGRVTDAAGAPAGGVYITFINVDTIADSETSTAADGTYDFTGLLKPGRYKVRFTAPGGSQYSYQKPDYATADIITIESGKTTVLDEQLLWVPTP